MWGVLRVIASCREDLLLFDSFCWLGSVCPGSDDWNVSIGELVPIGQEPLFLRGIFREWKDVVVLSYSSAVSL